MPAQTQRHSRFRFAFFVVALFGLLIAPARGSVTFDWPSSPGWTAGAPNTGQTFSQNFTSVSPNDINVAIFNSGVNIQGTYPQINSTNTTGGLSGVNALQLYISSTPSFGAYLQTTVTFTTAVTNLSFQIWDVDAKPGQFIDQIQSIQALAQGGGTVGADSVTSEVAGYNTITGMGLSTVVDGTNPAANNTNQGTIDIVFNQPITQFSFEWSNNDPNRGAQAIGLGPLTYDVLPEGRPGLFSVGSCLFAVLCESVRRRRAKQSRDR